MAIQANSRLATVRRNAPSARRSAVKVVRRGAKPEVSDLGQQVSFAAQAAVRPREYVTVQRAGAISGESPWTWRARAYRGDVESCKPAGPKSRLLIPLDEVQRFLAAGLRSRAVA